jgi:peptidoglycan/xylan/chitin deacetylase (PgdA/CDA1 family)
MRAAQPVVLAYHEIMPHSSYSYCVTSEAFRQQLAMLGPLAQHRGLRAQVTFDDGEQSQLINALPALEEQGISATYFVNPGLAGSEPKFLTWEQLKTVQAAGHSVQSHGLLHKFLTSLDDSDLEQELAGSKEILEQKLGSAVEEISVPGGRWDRRVIEACAHAGYKRVYVSDPWISAEMYGVKLIGRFMVRRSTTLPELKKIIERDRRALWTIKTRSQIRQGIVSIVGDGFYHRLWCALTGYNKFEAARQQGRSPGARP